ncbi:hypothetical protein AAT19DRAFT_10726 [Rhodotorula toruloides]|uniref:Uncharacterized protein n=1 Tax=Rhodotorula toruloides TaxID=5286 RepID=A0A2S9ZZJ6_RHOTO|nr:hypothetical protein AAT19DRAFT_10726 [Rhodotorula toruloides]
MARSRLTILSGLTRPFVSRDTMLTQNRSLQPADETRNDRFVVAPASPASRPLSSPLFRLRTLRHSLRLYSHTTRIRKRLPALFRQTDNVGGMSACSRCARRGLALLRGGCSGIGRSGRTGWVALWRVRAVAKRCVVSDDSCQYGESRRTW